MNSKQILSTICTIAAISAIGPGAARAADLPALPTAAIAVDDAALAGIRGKFTPAVQARVPLSTALTQSTAQRAADATGYQAASATRSPLSNLDPANGPIVYFGVTMTSSWTVTNGGVTQGVQAGATLNVDLQDRSVTVNTWSSSQNGGLPPSGATGNAVSGSPPASNISSGVGQSIQVAGNGNTISNQATVQYGNGPYGATQGPSTNDCGSACTFLIGPNGIGINIATPQGNVSQSIGAGGILQSAQVWSDLNSITNQLNVSVQAATGHSATISVPNASQIIPILPSITGIP